MTNVFVDGKEHVDIEKLPFGELNYLLRLAKDEKDEYALNKPVTSRGNEVAQRQHSSMLHTRYKTIRDICIDRKKSHGNQSKEG